jgi:hypothetical protein
MGVPCVQFEDVDRPAVRWAATLFTPGDRFGYELFDDVTVMPMAGRFDTERSPRHSNSVSCGEEVKFQ